MFQAIFGAGFYGPEWVLTDSVVILGIPTLALALVAICCWLASRHWFPHKWKVIRRVFLVIWLVLMIHGLITVLLTDVLDRRDLVPESLGGYPQNCGGCR